MRFTLFLMDPTRERQRSQNALLQKRILALEKWLLMLSERAKSHMPPVYSEELLARHFSESQDGGRLSGALALVPQASPMGLYCDTPFEGPTLDVLDLELSSELGANVTIDAWHTVGEVAARLTEGDLRQWR